MLRNALLGADCIVSPSAHLLQKCKELCGRDGLLIPSGTNPLFDELHPPDAPRDKAVLFVGSVESNKNPDLLLSACSSLWKEQLDFEVRIVGTGPMLSGLQRKWAGHPYVHFLGQMPPCAVREEMRKAAIFCLPSKMETLGLVFVEAMKQGMAVIGRNDGGIDMMGEEGQDYELAGTEQAIACKIRGLLENDTRRLDMACRGQKLAIPWTWENSANLHLSAYDSLLKNRTSIKQDGSSAILHDAQESQMSTARNICGF